MTSQVVINEKGFQRIRAGHPWVFRSDILEATTTEPGTIVSVYAPKKKFLAQAFYNPLSQITLRILTHQQDPIDKNFWKRRVVESIERRQQKNVADGVRLIYGEADFLPGLVLDRYRDVLVFQTLCAGIEKIREDLLKIFKEIFQPSAIVERNDPPVRELEGLVRQKGIVSGNLSKDLEILEGKNYFRVDPLEGQKTGLFLDQSENHLAAVSYTSGRVLDLFSYQGGFTLAVAEKATEVLAVDSSLPALQQLQANADKNQILNIKILEKNIFDFLHEITYQKETFDTVILDPPPFMKSRKDKEAGRRGYKEINLRAMKAVRRGGILITCSCSQNFTSQLFEEVLIEAARDTKRELQVLEKRGAASDHPVLLGFPESNYLQCWIVRVL